MFFSAPIRAALLLAVATLLTGGIHLDGLADSADGLSGESPQRTLAIMRDSRQGSFGVIAVVVLLLLKFAALIDLSPSIRFETLLVMPAFGRWSMLPAAATARYPREEGFGKGLIGEVGMGPLLGATLILLLGSFPLFKIAPLFPIAMLGAGLLLAHSAVRFFNRRIGGMTGDTLGALCETSEVAFLLLALLFSPTGLSL